jgi:hypothetical protein
MPNVENPWDEVPKVWRELSAHTVTIVIEACFLIAWAGVIWGVARVLDMLEPFMPKWAPTMFYYVEIGFALFLLLQMFLLRVSVFEAAIVQAGHIMRRLKEVMFSSGRRE